MFKTDSEGYSLIEVIVVLAIIGYLWSLAFASTHDYAGSIKLRAAIETMAVDMRLARVMARVQQGVLLPVLRSDHQLIHHKWVAIRKYSRRDSIRH
jgi:prepilin-type N-terminal cleavage/methylation domain-containing protein